ncbi:MAG: PKD domain-containing protein [Crocinitomicaceae bacterium]|nr:PKD domain-containing protein [Crocinitomicaceae bacterium]
MKTILTSLAIFIMGTCQAQDSASVLFIGNSYTSVNNLPLIVKDLTASLGDFLLYDFNTPGGTTFANHAANPINYTKINSQDWDYVILQAQSQEPSFPDSQVNSETIPPAMQLADSVYANYFCSEVLFYMTWGRENGDPQWGPISTFEGMNDRLRSAYLRMADSVQGSVSAVGSAWRYVRETYPTINLYAGDGSHPSYEGSYLAACTFYASIYRKSPVGATFIGSLDPTVAANLQGAAALTVLPIDSLELFNLHPKSELTQADFSYIVNGAMVDFTNESYKATSYSWDFGDLDNSTDESPSHTYVTDGVYTVILIATSPCDIDSIEMQITINTAGIPTEDLYNLKLKYLGNGMYDLSGFEDAAEIKLISMNGQELQSIETNEAAVQLDLSAYQYGVYIVQYNAAGHSGIVKIPYLND